MDHTKERKAVLYPVGIESSSGGQFAPIFKDKSFVYIPIPEFPRAHLEDKIQQYGETKPSLLTYDNPYEKIAIPPCAELPQAKTMGDCLTKSKWSSWVEYQGKKYSAPLPTWTPHHDPEFTTFTYGEGSHNKAKTLSTLREGDLLLFYASLSPPIQQQPTKKYLIGYFEIRSVLNFKPSIGGTSCLVYDVPDEVKANAHYREALIQHRGDFRSVIAIGNPDKSRLLTRAIPLTDENFRIYPELGEFLPWDHDTQRLPRGTRKFLKEHQVQQWWQVLAGHGPGNLYERSID